VTTSDSEPHRKTLLPFGLRPHEIGFLVLLGAAFYFCQGEFWRKPLPSSVTGLLPNSLGLQLPSLPFCLYCAALVAAVVVLVLRSREEWRQLPNKWFLFSLTVAWVALFAWVGNPTFSSFDSQSLPSWMLDIYTSPSLDEGHGLLIPFVVLALYWWKRKELVVKPAGLWAPAIGLIGLALFLHVIGFKAQQQRLSVVAFLLGLYGLAGLAWGRHWLKAGFFPFFLLVFCIPVGDYAVPLTMPLRLLVARIVEIIAHLGLAPDLIREGTQLFDAQHTFAYEVAAACSGIRSLVALLALTTIYGFVNFKLPWQRAVMMLIALPMAVLGNVVRLSFTIAVAETFGQGAGKAVETDAGYLTFAVAIGCVFLVSRWLEKRNPAGLSLTDKTVTP